MKHYYFVRDGWVVLRGNGPTVPPDAVEIPEPLPRVPYRVSPNGALVEAPQPSPAHTMGPEGWELAEVEALAQVRARRDELLSRSDWVALRAADRGEPVPPEWLAYRQALRDVTEQPGFPQDVAWPEPPDA